MCSSDLYKLSVGNQYSSLKTGLSHDVHRYQFFLEGFKQDIYPLLYYSQTHKFQIAFGSYLDLRTKSGLLEGARFASSGLMFKSEFPQFTIRALPLNPSFYSEVSFLDSLFISFFDELDRQTTSTGITYCHPFITLKGTYHHTEGKSLSIPGSGFVFSAEAPFTLLGQKHTTKISQIEWNQEHSSSNSYLFINPFLKHLSELRHSNSSITYYKHRIFFSKTPEIFASFHYLFPKLGHWIELVFQKELQPNMALQLTVEKNSWEKGLLFNFKSTFTNIQIIKGD